MYRPPVLQVSPQGNLKPLDSLPLLLDSIEVAERLGRVLVSPIPGIYHRHTGVISNYLSRPLPGVPDDNDISIAANYSCHIGDTLTLSQGSGFCIDDAD